MVDRSRYTTIALTDVGSFFHHEEDVQARPGDLYFRLHVDSGHVIDMDVWGTEVISRGYQVGLDYTEIVHAVRFSGFYPLPLHVPGFKFMVNSVSSGANAYVNIGR